MIQLNNIHVDRSGRPILKDINLTITEKRVGVVGANGSGKSTLIKLIKGLVKPTQGNIEVLGQDLATLPKKWHMQVGFIFQDPEHQIILPMVEDDLAFGLKNSGFNKEQIVEKTNQILQTYQLEHLRRQNSYHLSGGEKQLLALASVLVLEPNLVLFDEPTTLLDLRNKNRIRKIINNLSQSIVVVTHDLDLLTDFDRVIVLEKGKVVKDDLPAKALEYYVNSISD